MSQSPDDKLAIVLGQRQLIAVCCMFLVVLGLVSTLAYVTGRSVSAVQSKVQQEQQETAAPVLVVDSVRPQTPPGPMDAAAQTIPANAPVRRHPAAEAVKQPDVRMPLTTMIPVMTPPIDASEPVRGQTFWQVGVVDRGIAAVFVEHLGRQGLPVRTAAGPASGYLRVLVGPLTDGGQVQSAKRTLDTSGFQSFLKKY